MKRIRPFIFWIGASALLIGSGARGEPIAPDAEHILDTLEEHHPRLLLTDSGLARLKRLHESDATLARYVTDAIAEADRTIGLPALEHVLIGPRLLGVSRECVRRIYALGLAWRWTGEEKYAEAARENLLTVCAFDDWNPSHFLDVAEMSHAVGVGYDWLFGYLDAPAREKIRAGLIRNGMEPGLKAYEDEVAWWVTSEFNWNQVCNGGLAIGALAIAETDPDIARRILVHAVASLPVALRSYGPDGAWNEGPSYWNYATRYTANGLAALRGALGTDFGLAEIEGLSLAGYFPLETVGPTGLYLNFADSGERGRLGPMPVLFWLAGTFDRPFFAETQRNLLKNHVARPLDVIWYRPAPVAPVPPRPLDRYFRGSVEVAVFRSAWNDPDALFVGVKAGYNQVNHGHLDLGNFELDALGVRWARDLGSDDYNLPGYWDRKKGGRRWVYYRLRSASHGVPMLGGEDQDESAVAKFLKFESAPKEAFGVIDLTSAYEKYASKTRRGVAMIADRRAVLIQDEFEIAEPCEVAWAMTTDAEIETTGPGVATLTLEGKRMIARALAPEEAMFAVESAEQKPPEKANRGVRRLILRLPQARGSIAIAVLLSPVWDEGGAVETAELKPLDQW